jgi:integrase
VVVDDRRKSPVYAIRFNANGHRQYVTLGSAQDGWTQAKAQDELERALAAVRLGTWTAPERGPAPTVEQDPTFHEFSSDWFEASKGEWRGKTRLDYEWQLSHHLLPFFKQHRLSQITVAEVDRYRAAKVKQGTLSATSINKTITRLAQILEVAVEYGLIERNPARGKRRRLKATRPAPVWLDRAEQIAALLDAAGELDRHAKEHGGHDQKGGPVYRRALLATFAFAGLRIGELIALRWRDVDLAGGRITVRASKTDAGVRQIDLLPVLRDELAAHKAHATDSGPEAFVFATMNGTEQKGDNIRKRVLRKAVEKANENLIEAGRVPLPDGLGPHKLRHTFASILVALGIDPGAVMDQLGHTDPGFTLRVYRHGMRRDDGARAQLVQLVGVSEARVPALGEVAGQGTRRRSRKPQRRRPSSYSR